MKKKFLYIGMFFFGIVGYGQNPDPFKIPELTLPSPQASEITKYGDVAVDESSGRISPSIPLDNYSVGVLSVPVSLSYNGGGVKVMQTPTWTGMSWVLNAGGVITRVVRDLPDETNMPRVFYSKLQLDNLVYHPTTSGIDIFYYLPESVVNVFRFPEAFDSQVDKFNFSFPGYSGSFYLKEENGIFKAYLEKYENELKIEILGNFTIDDYYEIVITTPDGTKYYFGGITSESGISITPPTYTFEETQFIDRSVSPPKFGTKAKTSFYLRKMESYFGDIIYFEYINKDEYFTLFSRDQNISMLINSIGNNSGIIPTNTNYHFLRNNIYNGKFLKRIWSPQTSRQILFNSIEVNENVPQQGGGQNNLKYRVLNNINFGYKNYNFNYIPSLQVIQNGLTEKFFLSSLDSSDESNTSVEKKHEFEYINPLFLPGKISNNQDYLGFFNGQTNSSLLPSNSSSFFKYYIQQITSNNDSFVDNLIYKSDFSESSSYLGDREPFFNFATTGILKKITYPTGGYSTFEYEPVDKKILSENKTMYIYSNKGPLYTPNTIYSSTTDISNSIPLNSSNLPPPVATNQSITVNTTINTDSPQGLDVHDYIYLEVKDITPTGSSTFSEQRYYFPYSATFPDNTQTIFNKTFSVGLIKDHRYEFKIGFGDHDTRTNDSNANIIFSQTPMIVNASFKYVSGLDLNDGLGIRIKRTKDYINNNSTPITKRFYYTKIDELDSDNQINKPKIYHPLFHSFSASVSGGSLEEITLSYFLNLNSNATSQNLSGVDNHIYKNISISLGGDNFENGGIEKTFTTDKHYFQNDYMPYDLDYPDAGTYFLYNFMDFNDNYLSFETNLTGNNGVFPIKNGIYNGTLLKESYWSKENSILYKINEKFYDYIFERNTESDINNVNPQMLYECFYCGNISTSFGYFYRGLYITSSIKKKLVKTINNNFIDKIPITAYNKNIMYYNGWETDNHDNDDLLNINDIDYEIYVHDLMEINYKKIITIEEYSYDAFVNMPTSIKSTNNSDNSIYETKNYYLKDNFQQIINPGLTQGEIMNYTSLKDDFRINEPFQTETYKNSELLSKTRKIYGHDSFTMPHLYKIMASKGTRDLEDRIIYSSYDTKGNPNEVSLANGTKISYVWNYDKLPVYTFVNASISDVTIAINNGITIDPNDFDENNQIPQINTNPFIVSLPNAQATIYNYDPLTRQITSIVDPKGDIITYHYDEFNRLEFIKDKDGNILSENDYHYRTQN
jgi:hypothetical protein